MRVAHPSAWFQKNNKTSRPPEPDHLTAPSALSPFFLSNKGEPRPSSATSFRSLVPSTSRSTPTPTLPTPDLSTHPFAVMAHAPLPVVSSHDATEDEEDCPVCLEPLSFSFRLPGEKPHIVPECGHALHEVSGICLSSPLAGLWSVSIRHCMLLSRLKSRFLSSPCPRSRDLIFFFALRSPSPTLKSSFLFLICPSYRNVRDSLPYSLIPLTIRFDMSLSQY